MSIQNKQIQNSKRSPFVVLCEYASQNNWCWKIFCTTCGHSAFKISFAKVIKGQNPDEESFWPHGKENYDPLKEMEQHRDFIGDASVDAQMKIPRAEPVVSSNASSSKIRRSITPLRQGFVGYPFSHSSTGIDPWFSAKADKTRVYYRRGETIRDSICS